MKSAMPAAGFALRLPADDCLRIIDDAGCSIRVDDGLAWITIEGQDRDAIAGAGDRLVLERGSGALVSLFRDTTLTVSAPCGFDDVGFLLQNIDGSRVLTVRAPAAEAFAALVRWPTSGRASAPRPFHAEAPLA